MIRILFFGLWIIILALFYQCSTTNKYLDFKYVEQTYRESVHEMGTCYAKCLISYPNENQRNVYAIYTGDWSTEVVDLDQVKIEVSPHTTKWVKKKKSPKNCMSTNPDDCLVWCLVEIPAEVELLHILIDTTQSPHYDLRRINQKIRRETGGYSEWRQVLCKDLITSDFVLGLQGVLRSRGYYFDESDGQLDVKTKAALVKYQKENQLPIGQLDVETIKNLKLNI